MTRAALLLALFAACALPVAAQPETPVDLDGLVLEDGREVQAEPDPEFGEEPEVEPEPQRQGRILAVLYCPVLEGEPDPEAAGDAPGCTAGVGAALAWHDTRQGRVSLVGALSPDSLAVGLGWSWRESGVPFGLAVGVAIPYDGAGVYPDAAALVVGVSASVAQLLGRGGGE